MKSIKIIFTVVFCLTFSFIYAQSTSYKGVSVGRGISTEDSRRENVIRGNRENHFFTVHNSNDYPAKVKIEYIVGSKNGAWKMFEQYPEFENLDDIFIENEEEWTEDIAHYVDDHLENFASIK